MPSSSIEKALHGKAEILDLRGTVDSYVRWQSARQKRQEVAVATVTKADLLDAVSGAAGVRKSEAEDVLNAFFNTVRAKAKSGDKVSWPGFGSFSSSQRSARTGRNPQTGAAVKIPASTAMKFSSAQGLKEFMNAKGGAKKAAPAKKAAKKAAKKR
ncbi:MAG: HU family DNA-binding protein [Actinomycetota bacterium]